MHDTKRDIQKLIQKRQWQEVRAALEASSVPEITNLALDLEKPDRALLFRALPRSLSSDVFATLERETQNALLQELTDEETQRLLNDLDPDDRAQLLKEVPGQATQKLLTLLSPEDRAEALQLLGYPEDSVVRLMTPDYVAVRPDWTVGQSLEHIRRQGIDQERINCIYVTDARWTLLDALALGRFIVADPETRVEDIMDGQFTAIAATLDREEAARTIESYNLEAIPMVDSDGILVGIVKMDDVLQSNYRESTIWSLFRKRLPWLAILVAVGLVSSGIIEAFEETLEAAVALAFFVPLLIDSGGNTGSQSATLIVRAIATGDMRLGEWGKAVGREIAVGITLGVALGVLAGLLGIFRGGAEIGLVVGLSMASIVLIANLIGAILPFLLSKFKMDPAVASAPLITTVVDATGLLIYFMIASMMLDLT